MSIFWFLNIFFGKNDFVLNFFIFLHPHSELE